MEVNDELEDQLSDINFVPCVKFIKRGVASARNIADVNFLKFPNIFNQTDHTIYFFFI